MLVNIHLILGFRGPVLLIFQSGEPYTEKYIGSMVSDVHVILRLGGIYLYPATKDNPTGKVCACSA